MRRHLFDVIVLFVTGTLVAVFMALAVPSIRSYTITGYVFFLGTLLMLVLFTSFGDAVPRRRGSAFDEALAWRPAEAREPAELERIIREVTMAASSSYDLHYRLLPALREIARARLERAGRTPGPDTLGPWWELLRPDREPPEERFAPGISQDELRRLVSDLESM